MKVEKKQRKDPNKMDVILRLSVGDGLIFDVLDKCNDRTDLIKNALFYYILHIQNGMAIDKSYPYGEIDGIHVDGLNRYLPVTNSIVDPSRIPNYIDEEDYDDNGSDSEEEYSQDDYEDKYEEYEEIEEENYEDDNLDMF